MIKIKVSSKRTGSELFTSSFVFCHRIHCYLGMASFGGISVANSKFACLPCDDEAEIKRKNRGGQKKENDEGRSKRKENENQNKNKKKEKNSVSIKQLDDALVVVLVE